VAVAGVGAVELDGLLADVSSDALLFADGFLAEADSLDRDGLGVHGRPLGPQCGLMLGLADLGPVVGVAAVRVGDWFPLEACDSGPSRRSAGVSRSMSFRVITILPSGRGGSRSKKRPRRRTEDPFPYARCRWALVLMGGSSIA